MLDYATFMQSFAVLWAVIDPIGSVPVFISVTQGMAAARRKQIAGRAILVSLGVLVFFVVAGELLLNAISVPLSAFQISGGIILFLFALTMIFGESKPDEEKKMVSGSTDPSVFPLAIPSIASPGAMMAIVLLTDNTRNSIVEQAQTTAIMVSVLIVTYVLLRLAEPIQRVIGDAGASIVSRVMGLILASVAANNVLEGITQYFSLATH